MSSSIESDTPTSCSHFAQCVSVDDGGPSAYARLEAELGANLARMLVSALARPQGVRGSSSP
jgi:hypothetical protein